MTLGYEARIVAVREALGRATALLVGVGAGMSDAAGLEYGGRRFAERFAPFIEKYGLADMYSSAFFPFPSAEERWAYWARHIAVNRYEPAALPLYVQLRHLAEGRKHFVITTNVDHQLHKAGFSDESLFAVQGDYGELQCATPCHDTLHDAEQAVRAMLAAIVDCRIPSELVPRCPVCSGPMAPHLRVDERFVQGRAWHGAAERYVGFVRDAVRGPLVVLELGVGFNTPGIIRFPFERLVAEHGDAVLIRVNARQFAAPKELGSRAVSFPEEIQRVLPDLIAP